MRILRTAIMVGLLFLPAASARAANTAQQQKMKDCNAEATQKGVSGPERQTFMKTCLSGKAAATTGNSQQQKMKSCNTEATAKHLNGDARKQFMSSCLKGG